MTDDSNLLIRQLDNDHDRSGFHCGEVLLDVYIQKQARQDVKRHISRVFVVSEVDNPNGILGYYTLSSLSIELNLLPESLARKLPRHPVPAALLGRLAVSQEFQGNGIGKMLLVDAIKRTLSISDEIAIYAMVVDIMNKQTRPFYEQFGFLPLNSENLRLFLPVKSI